MHQKIQASVESQYLSGLVTHSASAVFIASWFQLLQSRRCLNLLYKTRPFRGQNKYMELSFGGEFMCRLAPFIANCNRSHTANGTEPPYIHPRLVRYKSSDDRSAWLPLIGIDGNNYDTFGDFLRNPTSKNVKMALFRTTAGSVDDIEPHELFTGSTCWVAVLIKNADGLGEALLIYDNLSGVAGLDRHFYDGDHIRPIHMVLEETQLELFVQLRQLGQITAVYMLPFEGLLDDFQGIGMAWEFLIAFAEAPDDPLVQGDTRVEDWVKFEQP